MLSNPLIINKGVTMKFHNPEEQDKQDKQDKQDGTNPDPSVKKQRAITVAPVAKIIFSYKSKETNEVLIVNRDLFSVTDAIGKKLSDTNSKEEMDDILVSIHSIEDPEKSDPLGEGESPWEGPYMVTGDTEIENMPIPVAMSELSKYILSPEVSLKGVERLAEQLFLRSRLDGFVFVGTFDQSPAVVPLISSFKDITPELLSTLYKQLHIQAERLKGWATEKFKDLEVDWDSGLDSNIFNKSGLVLPSGAPIETRTNPSIITKPTNIV
jgi:hypothetical protein